MPLTFKVNGRDIIIPDSERQECEVWDRVMGYFHPIQDWNIGKKQEHNERKRYSEEDALARIAEIERLEK